MPMAWLWPKGGLHGECLAIERKEEDILAVSDDDDDDDAR